MKNLFDKIFTAFSMQRWNDHIKTTELTEMDKQAHKMIIAYLIAKIEKSKGNEVNMLGIVEGSIFEMLHRLVVTDIKPPVFHKILDTKRNELNKWVISQLDSTLLEGGQEFYDKFCKYLNDEEYMKREKHILGAAHFLATEYEFKLIYPANAYTYAIEDTKESLEKKIEKFIDIEGVKEIRLHKNLSDFIKICGQLRFQVRWAQTPRLPRTNVLGHMYFVAVMSYFFSKKLNAGDHRITNNFFTALFHDLPEVLTRDIVTPVKKSIDGLDDIIKEIEKEEMNRLIFPLLPEYVSEELKYFTEDEFSNRIKKNEVIIKGITSEEISEKYDSEFYCPVDGDVLKVCDNLAAFMEAHKSIFEYGVKGQEIENAVINMKKKYEKEERAGIILCDLFC